MEYLPLTLPTPEENLAGDEALLREAEEGLRGELVRVWESPTPAIVLGASRPVAADLRLDACEQARVPILRRPSGGGTVVIGPGCLAYAVVLDHARPEFGQGIRAVDSWVLDRLVDHLAIHLDGIGRMGLSDLTWHRRKFAGHAQRRLRRHTLFHGTLLFDFDISMMTRWLAFPDRVPAYRGERSHAEFTCNLPLSRSQLEGVLRQALGADGVARPPHPALLRQLVIERYTDRAWIHRR